MSVAMTFYNQVHPKLKPYIKHYWTTLGSLENQSSKMLPMDHIDLVVVLVGNYSLIYGGKATEGNDQVFFHGIRELPLEVIPHEHVECFGISFESWGFYPFVNKPLSAYQNRSVFLDNENKALAQALLEKVNVLGSLADEKGVVGLISSVESLLLEHMDLSSTYEENLPLLRDLCRVGEDQIETMANKHHISKRTLERSFNRFIGVSPRTFYKIRQFEAASRAVLFDEDLSLTDIAHDTDYYDQAHFSKKFKRYTEETPKKIRQNKSALKSHMKFK